MDSGSFDASAYVGSSSENWIRWGKLIGTLSAAAWLAFVGGITAVADAYVSAHARILARVESIVADLLIGLFGGAGEASRLAWSSAFRAAIETSPMLAPILLGFEVIVVVAILSELSDRVM